MATQQLTSNSLSAVISAGADYGKSEIGRGFRVLVEFVSAQPNTPLTVTHARGGVIGDVLATLLTATGHDVQREFYVNDSYGSQPLRAFARAVLALYRQRCGVPDAAPETDGYGSAYGAAVAGQIYEADGDKYASLSTAEAVPIFQRLALDRTEEDQREALELFGIRFDRWFLESELNADGAIERTFDELIRTGRAEIRAGALWLRSSQIGDEQHDHVLRRADGSATYLAGDLAYHRGKFERGFDRLIDVWSFDHATYVARTRAGVAAMGFDPERLDIVVFQSVRVLKDGTEVKGSRDFALSAVTLEELIGEIGADAARFHLALGAPGDPLDLDLDAAKRPDGGPLGHVRAALRHARERAGTEKIEADALDDTLNVELSEAALLDMVLEFPSVVERAAREIAPQLIPRYVERLSNKFEAISTVPRPAICHAVAQVLENALVLLGIPPGGPPHRHDLAS